MAGRRGCSLPSISLRWSGRRVLVKVATRMNGATRFRQVVGPIEGILGAFHRVPLVALGEVHGLQEQADLIVRLIETPDFSQRVQAIVVEFGNALYQPVMNRFISGEPVSRDELRPAWRDVVGALHSGAFESPIYEHFFHAVRRLNRRLPQAHRLRVLLGDPPFDRRDLGNAGLLWEAIERRDDHFAQVVEDEVLGRDGRALLIAGAGHLVRIGDLVPPRRNVVQILEERHPGSTRVVLPHFIFEDVYERRSSEAAAFEARLADWPAPSLASVAGTWLEEIDASLILGDQARRIDPDGGEIVVEAPFLDSTGRRLTGVTLGQVTDDYLYFGRVDRLSLVGLTPPS